VTPQILLPLAGDLARPERRGAALSIVLSGLLLGILLARVLSGLIAEKASVSALYYTSFGLQVCSFGEVTSTERTD
jgi:MFS family permease